MRKLLTWIAFVLILSQTMFGTALAADIPVPEFSFPASFRAGQPSGVPFPEGIDHHYVATVIQDASFGGTEEEWNAIGIGYDNDCVTGPEIQFAGNKPILSLALSADTVDYGESMGLTAALTWPDGSTDGLAEAYPDAKISATLLTADGEVVPGFIVQTTYDLLCDCHFPFARDELEAGYYKIYVESNVENLTAETDQFYYTADKSHLPDPSDCRVEISLSSNNFVFDEIFTITATVTDAAGNPVSGIKVGFQILDSARNITGFYGYDYLWNLTGENGSCRIRSIMNEEGIDTIPPGQYIARVFLVDAETEIADEMIFEHRLQELHLPASLKTIEAEAFSNLSCQAVFIPDGCESIGEHAFQGCEHLIYVRIPASVASYPENAFEGCSEYLFIDQ